MSGTPGDLDVGVNTFIVQVDDGVDWDTATLNITVINTNDAPAFIVNPIIKYFRNYAKEGYAYETYVRTALITGSAVDLDGDTLSYSKFSGPAWLSVASNGHLSGTPGAADVGSNAFTVQVDATGGSDTATVNIEVANVYSGVRGIEDLIGFAAQWLSVDCIDSPACGGADLDDDTNVTLSDLAIFAGNWLAGTLP